MKTNQKQLHAALARCAAVVDRKATLPALANVRIVGGELTGSDLQRTVFAHVDVEGDPVSCLVSAHDLLARVGNLEGDVTITADESSITVKSGKRRYKLPTIPVDEYPTMAPPPSFEGCPCVGPSQFKRAIDRTIYAASLDVPRQMVNAVLFASDGGKLRAVATDGHRLATSTSDTEWAGDVMIPRESVAAIRKFIDRVETVMVDVTSSTVFVRADGDTISVKRSSATFPPWRSVVPEKQPLSCTVDASELASALVAVSLSADERMGRVVLRTDDGLRIEASGSGGEASDTIPADGNVPPKGWACSAGYLYDAVRGLDGDVTMTSDGSLDPLCVMHSGELAGIVMPVRS
jgi:DNA polymerase-3 subunit beta